MCHVRHQIEEDPRIDSHRENPHPQTIPVENETTRLRVAPNHPNKALCEWEVTYQCENIGKESKCIVRTVQRLQDLI